MKKLFQIRIQHNYYNSGLIQGLCMMPSIACRQFMESSGIFCKVLGDGVILYADVKGEEKAFFRQLAEKIPIEGLEFFFSIADSRSFEMTEGLADKVPFYAFASLDASFQGNRVVSLDLDVIERARERREFDGSVTIFENQIFDEKFEVSGKLFQCQLESRKTTWRYWIVNRNAIELRDPIVISDDGFQFDGPTRRPVGDGQDALVFSSKDRMFPQAETPQRRVFLRDRVERVSESLNGKSKPYPLVAELPVASPNYTNFAPDSGGAGAPKAISDIYVYL